MRYPSVPFLLGLLLSFAVSGVMSKDAVEIETPAGGVTIVAGSDAVFNIGWKNSTNNNVTISLKQGPSDNMTLIHIISPSTYNNGSFAWRADDDRFLAASSAFGDTHSGCNYSMEFRTGGEVINSDYFTILNPDDGGITQNMTCPSGAIAKGANTAGSTNGGKSSDGNNGSSVSTAALGGAVGGVAGGLVLLFALFFFVAKKSGIIISKKDVEKLIAERLQNEEGKRFLPQLEDRGVSQVDGGQVYQMP